MSQTKKPTFFQKVPLSWVIYLVALIFVIGWIVATSQPAPVAQISKPIIPESVSDLSINLQIAGSLVITLTDVSLDQPGFVVINQNNQGQPGAILGYSDYLMADQAQVTISLDQPLVAQEVYFAVIHQDNGDQLFDPLDLPATDSESRVILKTFTVN